MQTDYQKYNSSYGRIYKLTNKINSKPYIGQTTEKYINKRWYRYRTLRCKRQPKIYNALKKYGPENFLFEVIDTSPQNQDQLDNLEIMYTEKYDSIKNGYNCMPGGKGGKHSEESKKKMSDNKKNHNVWVGRIHSEETKRRMSEVKQGNKNSSFGVCGDKAAMWGKHHSEEAKKKMSDKLKGRIISEETRNKIRESLRLTREAKKLQNNA